MTDSIEYIAEGQIFHGNVPHVMGTRLDVLMVGVSEEKAVALWKRLCGRVNGLDAMLNRFDPGSEVSAMNATGVPLKSRMSDEMSRIVTLAEEYRDRTCGLFDVVDAEGKLDFGGFAKGYFLKENAVIGTGVIINASTAIFDATTGEYIRANENGQMVVPSGAVVVAGSRPVSKGPGAEQGIHLYCPVIVKYRDDKTSGSITLEDMLR